MHIQSEPLPGIKIIKPYSHKDTRGKFVKTFHEGQFAELGIQMKIREEFFSISSQNVLRGMHFQTPPNAHQKLVYCIRGSVLDVVLDLRKGSTSYGKSAAFKLSETNGHLVYIPIGFAHGFLSLENDSCLVYKTDSVHAPANDSGIHWNSIGYSWGISQPILSPRDEAFPTLNSFNSPF